MMMEFYPVHFYGYVESPKVASIKFDRNIHKLLAYDGNDWIEVPTENSFYYFDRVEENVGKIYLIDGQTISDICQIKEDGTYFQEGDVLVDIVHGNYLQLINGNWVIRYGGERNGQKVEKEVQELRKMVLEMIKELKRVSEKK